jgi:hypothetical protein
MTTKKILITGDYVIDHHLLKGNKSEASGREEIGTLLLHTYGGAKLTYDLRFGFVKMIESFIADEKKKADYNKDKSKYQEFEFLWSFKENHSSIMEKGSIHDSYLRWQVIEKEDKDNKKFKICKLHEKLGFGVKLIDKGIDWFNVIDDINKQSFETVVIDEAGIGFRNFPDAWPDFSKTNNIILKTTHPLCNGMLWNELQKHSSKLTTILNLNQLKHYNIKISNGISWEQTALDIVYSLYKNKTLKNLLISNILIITIGSAGAIVIEHNKNNQLEYNLVYDPVFMEGEWEDRFSEKILNHIGLGCSFLTGFVLSKNINSLKTVENVIAGLKTMTVAMLDGVLKLNQNGFEHVDLSRSLLKLNERKYYSAFIPSPDWTPEIVNEKAIPKDDLFFYIHNSEWSILENNYDNYKSNYKQKSDLFPLAYDLAKNGVESISYAPRLTLGPVNIFDRNEIENLRNIRSQVDFYDRFEDGKKPLNLAVFGPPGAGKSFIVKALAKSMFEGKKTKPDFLTFNLSQFKDVNELPGAFHAIRDSVLRGNLPIVFWDEFDSNDYDWLKSLIAPMQDGEFQEGKEIHPIGKAIFVFAGGMTYTMKHFIDKMKNPDYIKKKGPDFASRISGSLNVFGPNKKPYFDIVKNEWIKEGDPEDICFSIRRALFIRTLLGSGKNPLIIDEQLLRTLIEVSNYKGGARGLERLLKNLSVHTDREIEISDLPSKEIISMNVDYNDFLEKLNDENLLDNICFEKLAVPIHNAWLEKDVTYSVYNKKFEDLSYDGRLDNVSAARRIGKVIEKSGSFVLVSDSELISNNKKNAFTEFDEFIIKLKNLDPLAEEEHNGWMETRNLANWVQGTRSDYYKTHNCMVLFNELDKGITEIDKQNEKNKDRGTIRKYSAMLDGSGFTITKK